jgi:hypothetical protein
MSGLSVDQIGPSNPVIPVNFTGPSVPTYQGIVFLVANALLKGLGTSTNDNATAGYVGEYIESRISSASPVALTNNTVVNVTTLSLTAGDWQVQGNLGFLGTGTTANLVVGYAGGGTSLTSVTLPANDYGMNWIGTNTAGTWNFNPNYSIPAQRVTLTATTTIYLVAKAGFSGASTGLSAYGGFSARRMR